MKKNTNKLTFGMLKAMFPQAEVRKLGKAWQLHWIDGVYENSISEFPRKDLSDAKKMAFGMNDVEFIGNFRFSRTHTGRTEN